jgi:hypothetical protein
VFLAARIGAPGGEMMPPRIQASKWLNLSAPALHCQACLNVTAKSMDEAGRMWQAARADESAQSALVQMKNGKTTCNDKRNAKGTKE